MEEQAYLGELTSALLYLVAGVRLLRLASRSGELPERLLGAMFVIVGSSYVLYNLPIVFDLESLWTQFNFAGRIVYLSAPVLLAVFTRRVFRKNAAWSLWLVCGVATLILVGVTGSTANGDWEGFSISSGWFWLEWSGYVVPFVWAASEALLQYRKARRRLKMGLSNPMVCNRLLLWGVFAVLETCVWLLVLPQYAQYERQGVFAERWDTWISVLETSALATIYLTFFPPAVYRRWIVGRAASGAAAS